MCIDEACACGCDGSGCGRLHDVEGQRWRHDWVFIVLVLDISLEGEGVAIVVRRLVCDEQDSRDEPGCRLGRICLSMINCDSAEVPHN